MRDWLKQLRNELGMTQDDVAKKVGVTRQMIGMIENGEANPHVQTAMKIAETLDFKKNGCDWTRFFENGNINV